MCSTSGGQRYVGSITGLPGVAGALVGVPDLVFTSNRGENTVGLFTVDDATRVDKVDYKGTRTHLSLARHAPEPP